MVMYTMIVTSSLHFIWGYFFVFYLDLAVLGVSLATFLTYFSNFALITLYCLLEKDVRKAFFFFRKDSF